VDEEVDVAPEQALRSPRLCGGRRAGHLAPDLPPALVWQYLAHAPQAAEGPS
jgi:hypothetical protein